MQYTSKFALLAALVFGASALAVPLVPRSLDYEIEARELETDLSAREFYHMYLEARANPSLDARDVYTMDLEAREYLEYLEAREAANVSLIRRCSCCFLNSFCLQAAASETPALPSSKSSKAVDETTSTESHPHESLEHEAHHEHEGHHLRTAAYREKKAKALARLEASPRLYQAALEDKSDPLHHLAVKKYLLSHPSIMKEALADKSNVYHHAAKRIAIHRKKAKKYLSVKSQYEKALKHKSNEYHNAAVRKYLSEPEHMQEALRNEDSKYHKIALKIQKHHKHGKESMTSGAEPKTADSNRAVDVAAPAGALSHPGANVPSAESTVPKLAARWDLD